MSLLSDDSQSLPERGLLFLHTQPKTSFASGDLLAIPVPILVKLDNFQRQRSVDVKNECNLPLSSQFGTKPCLQLSLAAKPKMKCAWFRCADVAVYERDFHFDYEHEVLFLMFREMSKICVSFPTDGFPSAMAIAVVLGGDSRIYSGSDHHEGLRNGPHVRL